MISISEILNGKLLDSQSDEIQTNLAILLSRINEVRGKWCRPMVVTSGLRTADDQISVYKHKAEVAGVPFDLSKVPMGSQHLRGAAVDIFDDGLVLTAWLKENPEILESAQLWCEQGNKNWLHAQICPPKSGLRWFLP